MSATTSTSIVLWNSTTSIVLWNSTTSDERNSQLSASKLSTSPDALPNTTAGCIDLRFSEYIPWNNPDNIISFETEELARALKDLLFLPLLFLFGCPANIINMIVFYKHGLKERINVCLFTLSFADEVYMVNNMVWYGDQLYLRFSTKEIIGPVLVILMNNHLMGLHGFIWVSQILSAIIATDRCLCVIYPFRSQSIITTPKMVAIIITLNGIIMSLVFIQMMRYEAVCVYDPLSNSTMMTVNSSDFYLRHQKLADYLNAFVLGLGLPGLVMILVITTTTITVIKLRQAALWRFSTSSNTTICQRDFALTKMLVANSFFFIACVIPFTVCKFVFLFMPEVSAGRRHHNFFALIQIILLIISYFNASFNIIIYYTMGSRYRKTFWQLFTRNIEPSSRQRAIQLRSLKKQNPSPTVQ